MEDGEMVDDWFDVLFLIEESAEKRSSYSNSQSTNQSINHYSTKHTLR